MLRELKRGLLFTLLTMLLFGGLYPLAVGTMGRLLFPAQAEGSLLRKGDRILGSRLIAQDFKRPEYFHPRPSAVDYNAASAGGSNQSTSNPDHLAAVGERLRAIMAEDGVAAARVPSEMITASGSGLDPDVPPEAAAIQIARVAAARGAAPEAVAALVQRHIEPPLWGFLGRSRINVLELNLALDRELGAPAPDAAR